MKRRYKLKKKYFIVLCLLCASIIINIGYSFFFVYHIKLNGKDNIIVDVNEKYKDSGIKGRYRGRKIKDYKVNSDVDSSKPGDYKVEYTVGKKHLTRRVKVVDRKPPVINFDGEEKYSVNYKSEYIEPGFSANDNYDGDVTSAVVVKGEVDTNTIGEYKITYTVKDSFENSVTKTRIVDVVDKEEPKISFKNPYYGYTILNKKLKTNDYKVVDNFDGNLTDKVEVDTSEVNIKKAGIYEATYTVKDSNGNESVIKRKINVQKKNTKGIPVLMYHWFYDDTINEKLTNINVHNYTSKTDLIKQLEFLKKNNFYYPSWEELIDYIDGKIDLPEHSIIITDDDCVNSFFRIALPLFQKYEIPVTSFCITNKKKWKKYIGAEYLDFESHTHNLHQRSCSNMEWNGAVMCKTYDEIYKDIKTSVDLVKNTYSFAYPFGHYNDNTIKALKNNNIKLAFTINEGRVKKGSNKYKLPRVRISKGISIKSYENKVK